MRGRKPIPTVVKLRRNPRHKPVVTEREPTHPPLDPATPPELRDPVARAEWDRIAGPLSAAGQCTIVDRMALIAYAVKYAQWRSFEEDARTRPTILVKGFGGQRHRVVNPAFKLANQAFALMMKAAVELGVTPSARSRVAVVARDVQDEFTLKQQARPILKMPPRRDD